VRISKEKVVGYFTIT